MDKRTEMTQFFVAGHWRLPNKDRQTMDGRLHANDVQVDIHVLRIQQFDAGRRLQHMMCERSNSSYMLFACIRRGLMTVFACGSSESHASPGYLSLMCLID